MWGFWGHGNGFFCGVKKFCGFGRVRKGFWRIWKGLGGFCGFGKIWRFLQICNVFLRIWKGCGKASGGLEGFSLDLEGSGDVEGFEKVSGDLGEFGRIWKGFLGFGRISVPLERIGGAFGQRWDG